MMKPSNLYDVTDLGNEKSTLIVERVNININTVYSAKAENLAGTARSPARMVVEPHPLPETSRQDESYTRQIDYNRQSSPMYKAIGPAASSSYTTTTATTTTDSSRGESGGYQSKSASPRQQQQHHQAVYDDTSKSDSQRLTQSTRKISSEEMAYRIRNSPEIINAPNFLQALHETTVPPGEVARLDVRLVGSQPMEIRWVKDGLRIRSDRCHKMLVEGNLYTLLIMDCSWKDEGNYECVASNTIGETRCRARLNVIEKRSPTSKTADRTASTDQHITSHSSTSSRLDAYASSSRSEPQPMQQEQQQQHVVHLCICDVEHPGVYQCKASNEHGQAISTAWFQDNANRNVQTGTLNPDSLDQIHHLENPKPVVHAEEQILAESPKFLTQIPDYVEKKEGESVHFECCLTPVDDPNLKTEWLFNGLPLVTGSRFHTIDDFGFIVLDIDWLFPRDSGEYICRATNKHGTDITRTVLHVKPDKNIELDSQLENPQVIDKLRLLEFPEVMQQTFVDELDKPAHFSQHIISAGNKNQFNEGENVHFEARVEPATDGTLSVEWFHNDKPLISGHRFKPSFDFSHIILDILYVYPEDSGVYKCVARNATGTDVSTFEIKVAGKPSLVLQSQLPREMVGGVQRIHEMEAMWNRAPDSEVDIVQRPPPEFTMMKHEPSTSTESARFYHHDEAPNPKPKPPWMNNNQVSVETLNPDSLDQIRQLENPKPVVHVEEQMLEQPPKFLSHIPDYLEKKEGESVHFECCLSPVDDPYLKTEWLFNGRPLVTGSRFHTIDDFGFIVLDIDWLFPRDTGEYICRATNKHGTDITRTVLRVKPDKNIELDSQLDNPQVIDKLRQLEFPDVEHETFVEEPDKPAHFVQHLVSEGNKRQFNEGDNVHFEARVGPATDGTLTVEWFHNDKPLMDGHRFKPSFDFGHIILDILYVYPEDSGVYKCLTRNATGSAISTFEIHVTGKPSLVLQSQLPREMVGGVQKINEMEAMWNRAPDPEEEEEPAPRRPPEFVLKPKPCTAFEGSCARFCCRIVGNPKPRPQWMVNNQVVVSGSRYKLTYDGMYHLIIPRCQLSDAGIVKVYARNLLGDCFCTTELKVKRKVDDYRGVLKNSPNPWYDEQALKMYQRQRSQDLTDDEEFLQNFQQLTQRLQMAPEQQTTSPFGKEQVIGYMEPGTPDVNLLARTQSPLVEPGDLHPLVTERQITMMAPAPSTIQRALEVKDSIPVPTEKPFQLADADRKKRQVDVATHKQAETEVASVQTQDKTAQVTSSQNKSTSATTDQRVFGLNSQQNAGKQQQLQTQQHQQHIQQRQQLQQQQSQQQQLHQQQQLQHQQRNQQLHQQQQSTSQQKSSTSRQSEAIDSLNQLSASEVNSRSSSRLEHRLPPPSPENKDYGKEIHSQVHKQTQMERRANKEIIREIIEKETFEQEHSGLSKENVVRGDSVERGSSPSFMSDTSSLMSARFQLPRDDLRKQQQQSVQYQQHPQGQFHYNEEQQVLIEEHMTPPEFIHKIQPCQAIDGDEAKFECTFKGDPKPTISWFRENKMIKPSNLYNIITDIEHDKSTLIIKRVNINSDAVYTVKAENLAGSAKSSANLVVEPHPLPQASQHAGQARQVDYNHELISPNVDVIGGASSSYTTTTTTTTTESSGSGGTGSQQLMSAGHQQRQRQQQQQQHQQQLALESDDTGTSDSQKVVKSVRMRKISAEEMASLIRKSPEGLIAPTFLHVLHDTTVPPGDLARLDARLLGSQPMEVRWVKDGQRVRADRSHKMLLEGDLYTLLILECSMKDEGNYECVASNRIGEARCGAHLSIVDRRASASRTPDQMTAADQYVTSTSASSSQVAYASSSRGESQSMQYQQNQQQRQHQQLQQQLQEQQKQSWTSPSQKTHYGLTKHQYNPLLGQYTSTSAGDVQQRKPELPRVIKRLENQQVREGRPLTLRCQISSFPIAEVYWYKEGDKLIKPSKYFRIFKDNDETYCLKILEVFPEDQGVYKCVAKATNGQSQVETTANITVIPNSPR